MDSRWVLPVLDPACSPSVHPIQALASGRRDTTALQMCQLFPQLHWGMTDKRDCELECRPQQSDVCARRKGLFPPDNTPIPSQVYPLFLVRTFKFYCLSKFQLSNTVINYYHHGYLYFLRQLLLKRLSCLSLGQLQKET